MMTPTVNWKIVRYEYDAITSEIELEERQDPILSFDDVLNGPFPENARAYAQRLQADAVSSPAGHAFVNGKHFDVDDVSPIRDPRSTRHLMNYCFAGVLA